MAFCSKPYLIVSSVRHRITIAISCLLVLMWTSEERKIREKWNESSDSWSLLQF
jgi:hypothetical protein